MPTRALDGVRRRLSSLYVGLRSWWPSVVGWHGLVNYVDYVMLLLFRVKGVWILRRSDEAGRRTGEGRAGKGRAARAIRAPDGAAHCPSPTSHSRRLDPAGREPRRRASSSVDAAARGCTASRAGACEKRVEARRATCCRLGPVRDSLAGNGSVPAVPRVGHRTGTA